jgi:hypothetical protein
LLSRQSTLDPFERCSIPLKDTTGEFKFMQDLRNGDLGSQSPTTAPTRPGTRKADHYFNTPEYDLVEI